MADSTSDWDSMSEPREEREKEKRVATELERKKRQGGGRGGGAQKRVPQRKPPFDFSGEVPSAVGRGVHGKPVARPMPRKAAEYRTTGEEEVEEESRAAGTQARKKEKEEDEEEDHAETGREGGFSVSQQTVVASATAVADNKRKKKKKRQQLAREDTDGQFSNVELSSQSRHPAEGGWGASFESASKASGAAGLDNPAFQGAFDIEERPESYAVRPGASPAGGRGRRRPVPEEGSIYVYPFEAPADDFFQVDLSGSAGASSFSATWGDRALSAPMAQCCSWCMAELAGVVKVPFVILFVAVGQIFLFFLEGLLRPFSDFVLKPSLSSVHNSLAVPFCACARNLCRLTSHAMMPACAACRTSGCCCSGDEEGDSEGNRIKRTRKKTIQV